MSEDLEPALSSRSVPKFDTNAYLYAKVKVAKGTPLLPGQVYLFRDGTFSVPVTCRFFSLVRTMISASGSTISSRSSTRCSRRSAGKPA